MTKDLNIAIIQSDLVWENPEQNRLNFSKQIEKLPGDVEVIVLPEMFTTGFTMNAKSVAESMDGETVTWMKGLAAKKDSALMGSLIIHEDGKYYNRLLFVEPSRKITTYDKRHSFTLVGEHQIFTAGTTKVIINYKNWKICPLICYDLRFPVWARNIEDYDVLIYVANWPKPRISAWDSLLKARAIENMCYCIGVNRVGVDGVNSEYPGHSAVYDLLGTILTPIESNTAGIQYVRLEKRKLEAYRNKFPFLKDRDTFTLF